MPITIKHSPVTDAWHAAILSHARVTRRLDHDLREQFGLTLGWYEVLLLLASAEGHTLRMHELAEGMILSKSAATRLVDRLERRGLVTRAICDQDRRGMEVGLTEEGRDVFLAAGRLHYRGIQEHFGAHLSAGELATITDALTRVAEANR